MRTKGRKATRVICPACNTDKAISDQGNLSWHLTSVGEECAGSRRPLADAESALERAREQFSGGEVKIVEVHPPSVTTWAPLEAIKHVDEHGEHWFAREVQAMLNYASWDKFDKGPIQFAIDTCSAAGQRVEDNFSLVEKVSGKRGPAQVDYRLTKYAVSLIVQKARSDKPVAAEGQTYQAVRSHQAEVITEHGIDPLAPKPVQQAVSPSPEFIAQVVTATIKGLTEAGLLYRPELKAVEPPEVAEFGPQTVTPVLTAVPSTAPRMSVRTFCDIYAPNEPDDAVAELAVLVEGYAVKHGIKKVSRYEWRQKKHMILWDVSVLWVNYNVILENRRGLAQ